jgi:hypothetical protein
MSVKKNQDDRWKTNPGFWEKLKPKAREMRMKPTEAERRLWSFLRNGKQKNINSGASIAWDSLSLISTAKKPTL